MPTYLKHQPTGDLYIYTPFLAARADMSVVDEPDIAPDAPEPKPKAEKKAPAKKAPAKKAPEPTTTEVQEEMNLAPEGTEDDSDELDQMFS